MQEVFQNNEGQCITLPFPCRFLSCVCAQDWPSTTCKVCEQIAPGKPKTDGKSNVAVFGSNEDVGNRGN